MGRPKLPYLLATVEKFWNANETIPELIDSSANRKSNDMKNDFDHLKCHPTPRRTRIEIAKLRLKE